ncbi:hypothetical protein Dimus_021360 [Dionaea muscipula]
MCDFPGSVELSPSVDGDLAKGASLRHFFSSEEAYTEEASDSTLKRVDGGLEVAFLGDSELSSVDDSGIECSALRSSDVGFGLDQCGMGQIVGGLLGSEGGGLIDNIGDGPVGSEGVGLLPFSGPVLEDRGASD